MREKRGPERQRKTDIVRWTERDRVRWEERDRVRWRQIGREIDRERKIDRHSETERKKRDTYRDGEINKIG